MNSRIILIFHILSLLVFSPAKSQLNKTSSVVLNEIKKSFTNAKDVSIDLNYLNNKQNIKATLYFKNKKYQLVVGNQFKIIYDGLKTYNINLEDKEITVSNSQIQDIISPSKILNVINNSKNTIIRSNSNSEQVKVEIDKNSNAILMINKVKKSINYIKYFNRNKEVSTIFFKKYIINQNLSNQLFEFNKNNYNGYYITNLNLD